jgi:hypothetical protein
MSPVLASLLLLIRQHEGFEELKAALVECPRIQPFRVSDAETPETARSRFIYQSGQAAQHEAWLAALIGNETSQQENQ